MNSIFSLVLLNMKETLLMLAKFSNRKQWIYFQNHCTVLYIPLFNHISQYSVHLHFHYCLTRTNRFFSKTDFSKYVIATLCKCMYILQKQKRCPVVMVIVLALIPFEGNEIKEKLFSVISLIKHKEIKNKLFTNKNKKSIGGCHL